MWIEFDAQLLLSKESTGIAVYARNIIKELSKHGHYIQYNFFGNDAKKRCMGMWEDSLKKDIQSKGEGVKVCKAYSYRVYKLLSMVLPLRYSRLFGEEPDVAIFFNYVVPPGVKAAKVAVIHDMAYLDCPETVRGRTLFHLRYAMRAACRRADLIVTVSDFSRCRIQERLHIKEEKIAVVPCGIDTDRFQKKYSKKEIEQVKQKYGINGEYYLYIGTLEPRKNVERLLLAYAGLKQQLCGYERKRPVPKLVLAGRKGWMYKRIFELVEKKELKGDIIFTGYIDEQDKLVLLKGARIFVFPSLYEGFGIPVLEAMASGVAVLTSDCASMPEIVKDAGRLVKPDSVKSIQNGLLELECNVTRRKDLAEKGVLRSRAFSWEVSGKILHELLEQKFGANGGSL